MASMVHCRSCRTDVVARAPGSPWKLAVVFFWIAAMAVSVVFSLLLGLNIVLFWFALLNGTAIGVAGRRAAAYTCSECGEEVARPATEDAAARPAPALRPRPAG